MGALRTVTSSTIRQNNSNNNNSPSRWVYLLDQKGNLAQVVSPTSVRTGYAYQDPYDAHNLTAKYGYENKQAQLITKWTYDAYDRATSSTHKDGVEKVSVVYDSDTVIPTQANHIFTNILTNSVGETTDYRYQYKNGEAQLLSVIGAGCVTCGEPNVSYEYDSAGRVTKTNKLDDNGQIVSSTSTSYDTLGRTIKITQTDKTKEDNQQTWLAYSYDNAAYPMQPTAITRPSVVEGKTSQTSLTYDEAGNVVAMTESGFRPATVNSSLQSISRTTTYRYETINGKPQLVAVDGPLQGNQDVTSYQYDDQGRLTRISYPEGLTQAMRYDAQGRVVTLINIDGTTNQYQYDAQGQVVQSNQAGQISTISYDPLGRIQQITDPLGQILTYQYDAGGQIIGMSDGKQTQIDLTRDTEGNLTAANLLVDGKVEQHTAFTQEDNNDTSLALETLAPVVATQVGKDKNGEMTTAHFDDFYRVIAEDSPTTGWTYYEWDNEDNLTKVANELGQKINITYDGFGRIIDIVTNDDSAKVVWGDYNQKKSVIGSDYQLHYAYDQLGNTTQKTWQFADNTFTANYKYNDNQQLETVDYPSGLTLSYNYNEDGQLDQIAQKSWLKDKVLVSNLSDTNPYDNQSTFNFGNGVSQSQAYRDDEVVEWTGNKDIAYSYSKPYQGGYTIDYAYPNISTHTASTSSNSPNNQDSSDANASQPSKATAQFSTTSDQYNAIGQLIQDEGYRYQHDDLGRLTQVYNNDSLSVNYDYLITGERYKKSVPANNKTNQAKQTTYYLYDNGILISELTQTTTEDKPQFTDYVYHNNRPLLQFNELKPYYLTSDHRGAVMAVTDEDANIVWQAELSDNGQATVFNGSQIAMNLRGSNQYYDAETDLHYNIHRYFSPTRNQYLTPDPVGLAAGEDLYAFANDRPHEFVDLWGLAPEYEWYKNNKAAIIGTTVHNLVALGLRADQSANDWGGGDARFRNTSFTWPTGIGQKGKGTLLPDAYYVSKSERDKERNGSNNPNPIPMLPKATFKGTVWELKPESWMQKNSKSNYKKAQNQISDYLTSPKKGCWTAGLSTTIFTKVNSLGINSISALGKTYNIKFHTDTVSNASGLFFYSYTEQKKKEQNQLENVEVPDVVPAANKKQFEKVKDGFVALAKNSGLTALEIAGLVLLIILMIAVLRYPPAILAVLALLTSALSHARGKDEKGAAVQKVSLMESIGVALGIDNLSKADLLKKGKEYAAKKWDNVTKLFTGWFD